MKELLCKVNSLATPLYEKMPGWCFPDRPRRFHAYCVGTGKSGTVSIYLMFSKYRTQHEAESRFIIPKVIAFNNGKMSTDEVIKYIKHRDKRLSLEMDSSALNYFFIDILVDQFSNAKFILTIRDCYSWLDSLINHTLSRPWIQQNKFNLHSHWTSLRKMVYNIGEKQHTSQEQVLCENGLATLDGYFSYWAKHNQHILTTVPQERLFVVKTKEINSNISEIEKFIGVTSGSLLKIHGNTARQKFNLLSKIDKIFLEERANVHCGELMNKYFPEIKGFNIV